PEQRGGGRKAPHVDGVKTRLLHQPRGKRVVAAGREHRPARGQELAQAPAAGGGMRQEVGHGHLSCLIVADAPGDMSRSRPPTASVLVSVGCRRTPEILLRRACACAKLTALLHSCAELADREFDDHGKMAKARAGKPRPFRTFGQVTTISDPFVGTLSRLAMTSIW